MWSPHMTYVLVEVLCFIAKQWLCLDQNKYLLCGIITFGRLLGIDLFGILMMHMNPFQRKINIYLQFLIIYNSSSLILII